VTIAEGLALRIVRATSGKLKPHDIYVDMGALIAGKVSSAI
jgi:ATP-dependent Clp protease ATP-binding subunit ClpA